MQMNAAAMPKPPPNSQRRGAQTRHSANGRLERKVTMACAESKELGLVYTHVLYASHVPEFAVINANSEHALLTTSSTHMLCVFVCFSAWKCAWTCLFYVFCVFENLMEINGRDGSMHGVDGSGSAANWWWNYAHRCSFIYERESVKRDDLRAPPFEWSQEPHTANTDKHTYILYNNILCKIRFHVGSFQ